MKAMRCRLRALRMSIVLRRHVRPHTRDLRVGDHDREHCMKCGAPLSPWRPT